MWYMHPRGYYLVVEKNEALIDATWMALVNISLSGRSQSQKTVHCMIPFI